MTQEVLSSGSYDHKLNYYCSTSLLQVAARSKEFSYLYGHFSVIQYVIIWIWIMVVEHAVQTRLSRLRLNLAETSV